MKASELRLNNYYQLKGSVLGGGVCRITTIQDFEKIYGLMYSNSVSPIPLTEERLINIGFSDYSSHCNYKEFCIKGKKPSEHIVVRFGLQKTYFTIFNHSECDFTEMQYLTQLEYVHQLQNLYFALTGVELELSSNVA